jgi:hypothetical protein
MTDKQLEVLNSLLNEAHLWHAMWIGETACSDKDDDSKECQDERIKEACKAFNLLYNAVTRKLERI